jgi:predicted TPR repeat methyltransferase
MTSPVLRPILDIYEDSASFWAEERAQRPFPEKKFMEWVMNQLSAGDDLLDLGCGSGFPIADFFIGKGINVTGIDGAAAMIEIASESYPQAQWQVADMRTLSLNRRFHAIVAWDSFFHLNFSEQEKVFPIFSAHLIAGGALVFTSGPERGEAIGDMNGNPLFHASLSPDEYRLLLNKNGIDVVEFHPRDESCSGHTTWLCRATS